MAGLDCAPTDAVTYDVGDGFQCNTYLRSVSQCREAAQRNKPIDSNIGFNLLEDNRGTLEGWIRENTPKDAVPKAVDGLEGVFRVESPPGRFLTST